MTDKTCMNVCVVELSQQFTSGTVDDGLQQWREAPFPALQADHLRHWALY